MKRKETGLDERSEILAGKMDDFIKQINEKSASNDQQVRDALVEVERWPIIFSLASIFITVIFLFALSRKISALKSVSDVLVDNTTAVSNVIAEIFSIFQNLSITSAKQAEAVQQTAASIEEISAMAKRSSDNASESESSSDQAQKIAERGQSTVVEMVAAVKNIQNNNEEIEKTVNEGNHNFKEILTIIGEIGTKTQVINDIVFQTKLLSFNASVEAARAGEHGKGFAVVAEEVGNLAQMSGAAAQEISKLLDASVKKVESIVKSSTSSIDVNMKNAKTAVDRGNEVAQECAKALGDIVSVFREVKESVSSISQASQEQFYGVSEVSKALNQIDVSTQVALKSSQNATKVADELANKLKNLQDASGLLTKAIEGVRKIHQFTWTDEYLTGVELMDEEHKVLIEKMNTLIENMGKTFNNKNTEIIRSQYKDLADYAVKHFDDEENYFMSVSYPHADSHKEMHRKLIAKVVELEGKIGTPEFDPFAVSNFLKDWLMRHILSTDKYYGPDKLTSITSQREH